MDICPEAIEMFLDPNISWGDLYNGSPFKKGIAQRAVAQRVATIFKKSKLTDIGGFFYKTTLCKTV